MKKRDIKWINIYKSLFIPVILISWILQVSSLAIMAVVCMACFDKRRAKSFIKEIELPW
jgi:hypothetical protein